MKKIFTIAIFNFLLLCAFCCFAQSAVQVLQQKLSTFSSMTADFKQIIVGSKGTILQKSFGNMTIQRPGKFRWEIKKPLKQIIITDGKKVWIYDPDLQQVTIKKLDSNIGQTPALLLTSSHVFLQKSFNVFKLKMDSRLREYDNSSIDLKQYGEWFKLIPKNQEALFNAIIIGFKNNKIMQMRLENQLGQNTILNFSNVKINPKLNKKLFSFVVPKQVDVIDQTK